MTKLTTNDPISATLSKYDPKELLELINGLKPIVNDNKAQADVVLRENPDLTFAIVQAMLLMGLVNEEVISEVVGGGAQQPEPTPAPAPAPAPAAPVAPVVPEAAPIDKFAGMAPQQATMIKQILQLTPEQINALPADQQTQVRQLRAQYA